MSSELKKSTRADNSKEDSNIPVNRNLKVIAFGCHWDDPELGCGGTLAKYAAAGHQVILAYLLPLPDADYGKVIERETIEGCKILGCNYRFLNTPYGDPNTVSTIRKFLKEHKADLILNHPVDTAQREHRWTAEVVNEAVWQETPGLNLWAYEDLEYVYVNQLENPDIWIDISDYIEERVNSVIVHKAFFPDTEWMRDNSMSWAAYRGKQCGVKYAEVFKIIPMRSVMKPAFDFIPLRPGTRRH